MALSLLECPWHIWLKAAGHLQPSSQGQDVIKEPGKLIGNSISALPRQRPRPQISLLCQLRLHIIQSFSDKIIFHLSLFLSTWIIKCCRDGITGSLLPACSCLISQNQKGRKEGQPRNTSANMRQVAYCTSRAGRVELTWIYHAVNSMRVSP